MSKLDRLRVNYLERPIGIGNDLCFSWEFEGKQTNYTLIIKHQATEIYHSGTCKGNKNFVHVSLPLTSKTQYQWSVEVQDEGGALYCANSTFETAFVNCDFIADFITMPTPKTKDEVSAFAFAKDFDVNSDLKRARLYIVGLGAQRTKLNGVDIAPNDRLLTPTTNYDKTIIYNTYDITPLLKQGKNKIEVIVGNGFFNDATKNAWEFDQCPWRNKPMLKAQVHLEYENGESVCVNTDETWKVTDKTPIVFNNFRSGICYDARIQPAQQDYVNAIKASTPKGRLVPLEQHPVRIVKAFQPADFWKVENGYVFDAGENTSGFCNLKVKGSIGNKITLLYGEKLHEDKTVDQSNINCYVYNYPSQVHSYIIGSNEEETFSPDFTYCGFRYVQVEGLEYEPTLDTLTVCECRQDMPLRGHFECSDELINKIEQLCRHSAITNFHWIPTDCPHREKNGWTGDAQLSCEQMLFHYEAMTSYKKWLRDIADAQNEQGKLPGIVPTGGWGFAWGNGPAWDAALFEIPYQIYLFEDDTSILEMMYPTMEKYLSYLATRCENGIVAYGLGDWCPPNSKDADGHDCPVKITDTAIYISFLKKMTTISQVLGKSENAKEYEAKAQEITQAFLREFVDLDATRVESDSQTAYLTVLYHHLMPQQYAQAFANRLHELLVTNNMQHTCGIIGFKYLFTVLSDYGYMDTAFQIATQTTYPSIGLWIAHGATALYEMWQENQSLNHHMYSSISDWFYKYLAGIQIVKPGFEEIRIRKELPTKLDYVEASFHSIRGNISVFKRRLQTGEINCEVIVPEGIQYAIV